MIHERSDCRCCHSTDIVGVFNLGEQPYANSYVASDQLEVPQPTAPLSLMECSVCGHVQLRHVVSDLYSDYPFLTSSSVRMVEHFARLMNDGVNAFVGDKGLVVEIGSNDGAALETIQRKDVRRVGIDPAENLAAMAWDRGVISLPRCFGKQTAEEVVSFYGTADLIVACNVLGHVDDLDDFCEGVNVLMSADGALIVEVPDVYQLVNETEFDTIYHEHLSYFSVGPMATLFDR